MQRTDLVLIRARGLDDGFRALPFGLLDLTSYLEKFGFVVKVIDRHSRKGLISKVIRDISNYNPRYVGISAMTSQANDALKLGEYIKKKCKTQLIYGGLHFTVLPEEGLGAGNIVVRGEGENALLEILSNNINGRRIYAAQPLADLDAIPLPREDLIKTLSWGKTSYSLLTSRGCPYSCFFCLDTEFRDTRMRYHSIKYVVDFIELINRALNIDDFAIMDDIFTVNAQRVYDFCNEIQKRNLKIKLSCFSRAGIDNLEMYKTMKRAGFYNIAIGIESGNNDVLKAIDKKQTVQEARRTIEIIKNAGLDISATFMIGNITETQQSIKDTINFAKELPLNGWYVGFAQPFPGSRFYKEASKYGTLINKNPRTYWTNKISFVPDGLSVAKLRKLRKQFFRVLSRQKPFLNKVLSKIGLMAGFQAKGK